MPRIGRNPMRWSRKLHQPERVTVTTIVHIPMLEGYWGQSLEVLELCLKSMRESTQVPFDLMVFDNASCSDIQAFLWEMRANGDIQYLILSDHNIGKVGAWNFLFLGSPGEIISYADSDVYFLSGWLEATLEILRAFPKAGMVTAQPIAGGDISVLPTAQSAKKDPLVSVKEGRLIPDEYLIAHLKGLGSTPKDYEFRQKGRNDVMLSAGAAQAYATASHFQFTTTRNVSNALFPYETTIPVGVDEGQFDAEMQKAGFWRLSTVDYLVHHMGNKVPELQKELPWAKIDLRSEPISFIPPLGKRENRILQNKYVRQVLKKINTFSYKLLYER